MPPEVVGDIDRAGSPPAALDPDGASPIHEPAAPSRGAEVTERRTGRSRTFVTDPPGVFITPVSESPLHYRDGGGRWQEIGPELVDAPDGRLRNRSGPFTLGVAPTANAASLARLDLDEDHSVGFSLAAAAAVGASVSGEVATYAGALPEVDLRLTSHGRGLKEEIVLASAAAPDRFAFPLELRGLTASIDADGDVVYADETGRERARTPRGFMTDAAVDPASGDPPSPSG